MLPLQQLATERFGPLTDAELKLLEAATEGRSAKFRSANEQENDPNNASTWGDDRTIRSSIVRWLCRDKKALACHDSQRIAVTHARLTGELDLSGSSLGFSLLLIACAIPDGIDLSEARLRKLDLTDTVCGYLLAWGLSVEGNVFLRKGFRSHGPVVLTGASIRGDLECINARIGEPTSSPTFKLEQPDVIFWADRLNVNGQVALRGMKAVGIVSLSTATINGGFDCRGADISIGLNMRDMQLRSADFRECKCPYLVADRVVAKGSFFLRKGFQAVGSVVLLNSSITGDLDCNGSSFGSPTPDTSLRAQAEKQFGKLQDSVLILNGSTIGGYVFLGRGFRADGMVYLNGVTIGANLYCGGGHFFNAGKQTLSCQHSNVKGTVFCGAENGENFQTDGRVQFIGTTIAGRLTFSDAEFRGPATNSVTLQNANVGGTLEWKKVRMAANTALNLSHLKVGQFEDDEQSWPAAGRLLLDGFSYGAIANIPLDSHRRKTWLTSHLEYLKRQAPDGFSLQPHRQLADTLRKSGYEDNAREVLIDMHKARREQGGFSKFGRVWSWILQGTIGFGYRSHRTFLWALLFVILGAVLFNAGYRSGHLVAAKPDVKAQFSAIGYSVDSFLPIINLRQEELWVPAGAAGARWIQYYYWVHICLGWALITLGVAGFTGLVRKE